MGPESNRQLTRYRRTYLLGQKLLGNLINMVFFTGL